MVEELTPHYGADCPAAVVVRASWPDVPTSYLLCREDRLFPAAFVRTMVADRLGLVPDEIDGSHHPMLSRPRELAARLAGYAVAS